MNKKRIAQNLESISSPVRLDVVLALINAGKNGMVAGDIARHIGVSPNNLSFHLRMLTGAGFVSVLHEGRYLRYSVAPQKVVDLVDFFVRELRDPAKKLLRVSYKK